MIPASVVEAALNAERIASGYTNPIELYREGWPRSYTEDMAAMRSALEAAAPLMAEQGTVRSRACMRCIHWSPCELGQIPSQYESSKFSLIQLGVCSHMTHSQHTNVQMRADDWCVDFLLPFAAPPLPQPPKGEA